MNRTLILAMVLASSVASTTPSFAAGTPVYGKAQTIKFSMRNDTASELKLRVGDTLLTLAPGKSINVQLPLGQKIVAAEASGHYAQGDLLSTVSDMMKGNTLAIK